jgi:hypothetical protein
MPVDPHRECARSLTAVSRFLVFAVDHHDRTIAHGATCEQVRVRRLTAAADIASATRHLADAAMWLAMECMEADGDARAHRRWEAHVR